MIIVQKTTLIIDSLQLVMLALGDWWNKQIWQEWEQKRWEKIYHLLKTQESTNITSFCFHQLSSSLQLSWHTDESLRLETSFPILYIGWQTESTQSVKYGCRNVTNPLMCTMLAVPRVDVNTLGLNHPAFGSLEAVFPRVHIHIFRSPGWELSQCLLGYYSTERSWQDLDLSQNATLGLFFATTLSRKRLAFVGMLSQCVLHFKCLRRLLASLESLRRRSCRTMPWKASQTLCCMAADVSINLQSNTAAQARPSETESQT